MKKLMLPLEIIGFIAGVIVLVMGLMNSSLLIILGAGLLIALAVFFYARERKEDSKWNITYMITMIIVILLLLDFVSMLFYTIKK